MQEYQDVLSFRNAVRRDASALKMSSYFCASPKTNGAITLALLGHDGGKIAEESNHCLCIPSQYTPAIQEAHIIIIHILCNLIEKKMFGDGVKI